MRSTGIQAIAYNRLKAHLGIRDGRTRVFDMVQQLAEPEAWYLDRFRIAAVNAGREFAPDGWKGWTLPDGSPCEVPAYCDLRREGEDWVVYNAEGVAVGRMIAGATYFSQDCFPMADDDWEDRLADLPRQMGRVCWASMAEPIYEGGLSDANLKRIGAHLAALRRQSDRAIMIAFGANLFEWGSFLRRMDNFLLDLAAEPAKAAKLLDKLVEAHLAGLDRLLPVLGDNVDLIQLGDDLGTEGGPFFSPEMYRELFLPRHRAIVSHIKRKAPRIKVFLHSCGSLYKLLPSLIEAGFDVVNPVQISAHEMEPERLKREFGRDIAFWGGGCNTQSVLPRGTPQQVKDDVRRNIDALAPGGGFIFCQVHNILSEVPPANIVAMYEAAMA